MATESTETEIEIMDMKQVVKFLKVTPRVIYAAFKSGDLAGRNLGGRKGWVTTKNSVLDWVESGNDSGE